MVDEETAGLAIEEMERYDSRYENGKSGRSISGVLRSDAWSTLKDRVNDEFIGLLAQHVSSGDRVLDYAGGYGNATRGFFERNPDVAVEPIVLDVSIEELRRGRTEEYGEKLEPVRGDAHQLPFGDATFDAVVARHAFHHLPDWHRSGLDEIRRVLGEDGALVFKDPLRYNPFAWTFRRLCETREKTDAEVPLNSLLLRDRLERVFDDVSLQGHFLVSPAVAMLDRFVPVSTTTVAMRTHRVERGLFSRGAFPLAGGVVGVARDPL